MSKLKIVFMGTPEIALPALERLWTEHEISAICCQPDKPVGRKRELTPPPTKVFAQEHGIRVLQPQSFKDGAATAEIRALSPDMIVVMAYGKILPQALLDVPPLGSVNIHASLLPKWRGAAPIQRSIAAGDTLTGVTTMYMSAGLDEGDMIENTQLPIGQNDTEEDVSAAVAAAGAKLISHTVRLLEQGNAPREPQNAQLATWAPILKKEDGEFNWNETAQNIHNKVRAFCRWPTARFVHGEKTVKLQRSALSEMSGEAGTVLSLDPLVVGTPDRSLELLELTPEGSRRMSGTEWARGLRLKVGDIL